jgi:signal transduction histidine kinase
MRTRTRFALLFAGIAIAALGIGLAAIYEAVGLDAARRSPAEAESTLSAAATRALDESVRPVTRLEDAVGSIIAARALLAEGRVLRQDAVIALALELSAILAGLLGAAAVAFFLLSRLITRGLDGIAAGALAIGRDRAKRFDRSRDPDLDAVSRALNELLDLTAEQERRLSEAARLEGWREVASFLAHQLKNPLAALLLAAENGGLALEGGRAGLARESLGIVRAEGGRLKALLDRFRDLAPAGLGAYGAGETVELLAVLKDCGARAERSGASFELKGPSGELHDSAPASEILGAGAASEVLVAGERALLEQAFWNLFANSVEAGSGGIVGIEARVEREAGRATVLVLDTNRGFDPALLAKLGRERLSTKSTGAGLGLILVRRILAVQGGSLELFATEAGGLGARVGLPLLEAKEDAP